MQFVLGLVLGLFISLLFPHRVTVRNDSNLTCPEFKETERTDNLSISLLDKNEKLTEKLFECHRDLSYERSRPIEHCVSQSTEY